MSLFVNEKPLSTLEVDKAQQALRCHRPGRRCCTRATTACGCTFKSAADVAGGKRAAAARDLAGAGPGRARPPAGALTPLAAREVDPRAARASARWSPGGAGSRLSFYLQLPEGAHLALAYGAPARAARSLAQVAVDGKPAAHAFTRATSARAGPRRWSISAPPAARRRASI